MFHNTWEQTRPDEALMEFPLSWLERLDAERNAAIRERTRNTDPWRMRLEQIRGKVDPDNVERIPSAAVYDFLGIPMSDRGTRAARRISQIMAEFGWTATRIRGMRGTHLDQVRGYARKAGTP
jgi:hypothetical protein